MFQDMGSRDHAAGLGGRRGIKFSRLTYSAGSAWIGPPRNPEACNSNNRHLSRRTGPWIARGDRYGHFEGHVSYPCFCPLFATKRSSSCCLSKDGRGPCPPSSKHHFRLDPFKEQPPSDAKTVLIAHRHLGPTVVHEKRMSKACCPRGWQVGRRSAKPTIFNVCAYSIQTTPRRLCKVQLLYDINCTTFHVLQVSHVSPVTVFPTSPWKTLHSFDSTTGTT